MIKQKGSYYFSKTDFPKVQEFAQKYEIKTASELVLRAIDSVAELSEMETLKTALEKAQTDYADLADSVVRNQELIAVFQTETERAFMQLFGETEPIKLSFALYLYIGVAPAPVERTE